MLNQQVLVLNKHWVAIHICTVRRALTLLFQELARVVHEDFQTYDFESWRELSELAHRTDPLIHTPNFQVMLPQVILLTEYNRFPPHKVKFNRRNIFIRDNYTCQFCGRRPREHELTIDHVIPRSRGGHTTWENVVLACVRCNVKKGNRTPVEASMHLTRPPKKPSWVKWIQIDPADDQRSLWQKFLDTAYWETNLRE